MNSYELTNQEVLHKIRQYCPESLSAYLRCIDEADADGLIIFSRSYIQNETNDDVHTFRKHIKNLARLRLLEWSTIDDSTVVQLGVDYD
jgi:hypothetical protein